VFDEVNNSANIYHEKNDRGLNSSVPRFSSWFSFSNLNEKRSYNRYLQERVKCVSVMRRRLFFFFGRMYEHSGWSTLLIAISVIIFFLPSYGCLILRQNIDFSEKLHVLRVFWLQVICRENNLLLNVAGNWFTYVDLPSACNWFSRRKHRLKICS